MPRPYSRAPIARVSIGGGFAGRPLTFDQIGEIVQRLNEDQKRDWAAGQRQRHLQAAQELEEAERRRLRVNAVPSEDVAEPIPNEPETLLKALADSEKRRARESKRFAECLELITKEREAMRDDFRKAVATMATERDTISSRQSRTLQAVRSMAEAFASQQRQIESQNRSIKDLAQHIENMTQVLTTLHEEVRVLSARIGTGQTVRIDPNPVVGFDPVQARQDREAAARRNDRNTRHANALADVWG